MENLSRRNVIKRSVATAAALSLPLSSRAFGAKAKSASSHGPSTRPTARLQPSGSNSDIRIAVIGFNGRGQSHIDAWRKMKGVRLVALCDADEAVLNKTADRLDKQLSAPSNHPTTREGGSLAEEMPEKPIKVQRFTDLRKIMDSKEIDAISIATPNHWHALAAIWGLQSGKDVYVEKPVSHNVWEGRQIVEAANKYNKICQTGTQSRSIHALREAFKWVREGNLGKIQIARGMCYKRRDSIGLTQGPQPIPATVDYDLWAGPREMEPLRRKRFHYDWHWFWHTGNGDIGNQGIHEMDKCRWALGKEGLPKSVFSVGGRFGYKDDAQTANTQFAVYDYGDALLIFEVRGLWDAPGTAKMSSYKGESVGQVIECEGGYLAGATAFDKDGKQIKKFSEPGEDHFGNFIKAVRSRKTSDLNAPILEGHLSSALCHLGNISYRLGQQQESQEIEAAIKSDKAALETFDRFEEHLNKNDICLFTDKATLGPVLKFDSKTERFVDNDKANAMLRDTYRKPFVVPETV